MTHQAPTFRHLALGERIATARVGILALLEHQLTRARRERDAVQPLYAPGQAEHGRESLLVKERELELQQAQSAVTVAEIDLAAVPVAPSLRDGATALGVDALEVALGGGEDYELLATMPSGAVEDARARLREALADAEANGIVFEIIRRRETYPRRRAVNIVERINEISKTRSALVFPLLRKATENS